MLRRLTPTLLLLGMLYGCAPPATPTPAPPPAPRAAVSTALAPWLIQRARAFMEEQGPLPFDLETLPPQAALEAAADGQFAFVITASPPPEGWFATPLGMEGVAVVVHPDNKIRQLGLQTLGDLFSGRLESWEALGGEARPVQAVLPLSGDEMRELLQSLALGNLRPSTNALLAPTTTAALTLVAEDPGAVGLVPLSAVSSQVRAVRVEGVLPATSTVSDGRYPLTLQVLAVAPQEPQGALRDWLVWLQSQGP